MDEGCAVEVLLSVVEDELGVVDTILVVLVTVEAVEYLTVGLNSDAERGDDDKVSSPSFSPKISLSKKSLELSKLLGVELSSPFGKMLTAFVKSSLGVDGCAVDA